MAGREFYFCFNQTNFASSFVKERPYGLAWPSLALIFKVTGGRNGAAQTDHGGCIQGGKRCQECNKPCTRGLDGSLDNMHITKSISHIYPKPIVYLYYLILKKVIYLLRTLITNLHGLFFL